MKTNALCYLFAVAVAAVMAMPHYQTMETIVPETDLLTNSDGGSTAAAIEEKVAAKGNAQAAAANVVPQEAKDEAQIAKTGDLAVKIIDSTQRVTNNIKNVKAAIRHTGGAAAARTVKVENDSKLALAKCKALKTKVYEDCRVASCRYTVQCGSKRAGKACMADEKDYQKEKKEMEIRFKSAEAADQQKEAKHKKWLAGTAERHAKAVEAKRKYDAEAPLREIGDKNFAKIMGESMKNMQARHRRELAEEGEKSEAKRQQKYKAMAAADAAATAKFAKHHPGASVKSATLLEGQDWADTLIPSLIAGRRLLSAEDEDRELNSGAEKAKVLAEAKARDVEAKEDEKRAHSTECKVHSKTMMSTCAELTQFADESCETQLKKAEGDFSRWTDPETGHSDAGDKAKKAHEEKEKKESERVIKELHNAPVKTDKQVNQQKAKVAANVEKNEEENAGSELEKAAEARASGKPAAATAASKKAAEENVKAVEADAAAATAATKA